MNRLAAIAVAAMLTPGMTGIAATPADYERVPVTSGAMSTHTGPARSRTPANGCTWINIEGKWYCF